MEDASRAATAKFPRAIGAIWRKLASDPPWAASLCVVGLLYAAHVVGLPILVTYDGHWYVRLAAVLGTPRFAAEWDFLRGPLYPLLLKISFSIFGLRPAAVTILQAAMGFAGLWLVGDTLRRLGRRREAPVAVLLLGAFPTLIAYQHMLLTEAVSFFFLALLVRLAVVPSRSVFGRAVSLTIALTLAYYYRSSFIWLAPACAAVFCLSARDSLRSPGLSRSGYWKRIALSTAAVTLGPFILAYPWARNPEVSRRTGESVLLYGLAKQAVIPPDSPLLGASGPPYRLAIAAAGGERRIPLSGISDGTEYVVAGALSRGPQTAPSVFREIIRTNPRGYLRGLARTTLMLSGLGGYGSDSAGFRTAVLSGAGSVVHPGPPGFVPLGERFRQPTKLRALARGLDLLAPVCDVLVFLGAGASLVLLLIGLYRRDAGILGFTLLPLTFLALHALVLSSQDRMAVPVYPVLLANLVALPGWLPAFRRKPAIYAGSLLRRADPIAFRAFVVTLLVLAALHGTYLVLSKAIPSSDEAHYMTGVASIGGALRTLSPRAVSAAYVNALGFKPPLICIPAAFLNVFVRDVVLASKLSQIVIFLALGLASFSLFRNLFRPVLAAFASLLLVTAPVVTGLTHRFYVEGLTLLVVMVFLDLLLRVGFTRWWGAILLGFVLGLGLLTKALVAPLLAGPLLYAMGVECAKARKVGLIRAACALGPKLVLLGLTATAVAATWYGFGRNLARVVRIASLQQGGGAIHAEVSFPVVSAFLSLMSCGPFVFVSVLAAIGALAGLQRLSIAGSGVPRRHAWSVILLSSGSAILLSLMGASQAVRYIAAMLPMVSVLAVYGVAALCPSAKTLLAALAGAAALSVVLMLHNSFEILPIGPVRAGNLRFLDCRFPLNAPDWFDDNHPLERRDFGDRRVFDYIAAQTGRPVRAGLLVHGLVINHDYLGLLAQVAGLPIRFLPWYWTATEGPNAPEFLISCIGCGSVYPGRHYYDRYAGLRDEFASGRGGYHLAFEADGDAGCRLLVYRKDGSPPAVKSR